MFLRAEQYEQIVASLRSVRDRRRSAENRASTRVGLRVPVRVIPCRKAARATVHTAWVRDLSVDSVGLLMGLPIQPGTYLIIHLERTAGPATDVLFKVRRCEALGNGQFSIGAVLDRVISPDDVK